MRRHMAILILSCSLGLGRPPQGALAGIDAQALGAPLAGGRTTAGAGVLSSGLESFKADLFMGIASYRIPIRVPPGTAGMQPDLALTYRSGGSDGWVGFGWDLGVPAIRRSTKFGVPRYADDAADPAHDRFVLGDDNLAEFSEIDYATELESYARIRRVNRGTAEEFWEVTRGDGRVLVFGDTAGTRIEKAPGQIFAWLLHTETDVLGNGLTYAYDTTTDPGVAYLSQITYTSHPGEAAMNTRTVSFTLESRPDPFLTCQAGFPQQTNFRLGQITVALGGQLVRRYDLIYATSPSGRSLLEEIRMVGSDGQTAAPAQKFAYQTFETGFRAPSDWLNPSAADDYVALRPATAVGNADYALLDLTGDGLPDRVTRDKQDDLLWKVYPNRGDGQGFQEIPLAWPNPSAGEASQNRTIRSLSGSGDVLAEILDLDGDGRPDRVTKGLGGDKFNLRFFRNTGEAFAPGVDWPDPAGLGKVRKVNTTGSGFAVFADLIDMNGDGLPDRVSKNDGSSWLVYLHTGAGFAEDPILWSVPTDTSGKLVWDDGGTKADVFDINGDGLPDRILATDHNATSWTVHFGTGWGFMAQGYAWPNPSYAITEGDGTKIRDADGSGNLRVTVADMNGDGLVDRVVSDKSAGTFVVWPSSGMGFSPAFWVWGNPSAGDNHPQVIDVENQVTVADLVDLDGDQLPDRVASESRDAPWQAYFSNTSPGGSFPLASKPDLLTRIENGMGGSVTLTYASSTKYLDAAGNLLSPNLPSPVITLASSTFDDGRGTAATTRYAYAEGRYDAPSREFRGFGRVTVTGPAVPTSAGVNRAVTETLFHQDDQLKALPSRVTIFQDTDGDQSILLETSYAYHADPSAPYERLLASSRVASFGAGQAARLRKTVFPSYLNGAPTEVQDLGEVLDEEDSFSDGTADERITQIAYAESQGGHLVGLPSHVTVTTGDPDDRQSERWFYYDDLPLGQALAGLQTRVEEWLYDPFDDFTLIVSRTFVHDAYGNITGSRDPNGRLTRTEYDATFHTFPVAKILPPLSVGTEGMILSRTFDAALGVPLTETDLNGNITRTSHDVLGRRVGTFFTPAGRPEFPLTETLYHDALLGVVDDGETGSPSAQHLTHRRFIRVGGAEVLAARIFFDGLGRPIRHESPGDQGRTTVVTKGYDPAGRLSTTTVPFFEGEAAALSLTEHDALGRPVRQTRPDGTVLLSSYELWDRTDELLSPSLESLWMKTTRRDAFGRVIALEEWNPLDPDGDPGPTSTLYAYDPRGNLTMVTDPQGNLTSFLYDTLGRKVAMADPNTGNWRYEYDLAGNLSRRTDARGVSVTYAYDALDRLLSRTSPEGTVTFEYDSSAYGPVPNGLGRLIRARSPSLTQDFQYDALGNVKQIDYMNLGRLNSFLHTFDLLGREVITMYPDRELVTREYDGPRLTRVSSVHAPGGRYLEDASYDAIGRPTHLTLGNGASITYRYDPATTRLSAIQATSTAGTALDLAYHYTAEGNIEAIDDQIEPARSQAFTYDSLGRILSAQGIYGSESFRYDPIGNLVEKGGMTLDYAVGPGTTGGPQAVKSAGAWSFDYDANGNMTRMGALTLSYDAEGRLSTVREGGATLSARRYDAFGRRWRDDSGRARWFFGDDFEWDGENGTKTIFAGGRPIAARTAPHLGGRTSGCAVLLDGDASRSSGAADLLPWAILLLSLAAMRGLAGAPRPVRGAARATGVGFLITAHLAATAPVARALPLRDDGSVRQGTLFYVLDHLGSTSLLLDEEGTVVREVSYDPWGAVVFSEGSVDLERKFTGQRLDSRTGLYDYGARTYHPGLGRFVQPDAVVPDPASSQALNRYAYVTNNPLRYTDPTGHFPFLPILLGAAFGAVASHVQGGNPWVGALIGGISGGVGAGVSAAIGGGAGGTFAGGVAAGFLSGGTHGALRGSGALRGALLGGLTGGLLAGVSGLNIRGFGLEDLVNPVYRELARITNTAVSGLQMVAAYGRRALDALTFGRFTAAFNRFQNVWNYPNHAVADSIARDRHAIPAGKVNGAEVYAVDEVPLGAEAVTLGRRIFVPRNAEGLPVVLDPKILDHELGHVAAFNLLGPLTIPLGIALGLGASPIALGVALSHPPDRFLANLREALYTYHPGEQLLISRGSRFPESLP